jgi:hypothetical protein
MRHTAIPPIPTSAQGQLLKGQHPPPFYPPPLALTTCLL